MRKVRRDDTVFVLKGKDRGRIGQVRKVIPKDGRVIVTGVNLVKRHMRPRGPRRPGGIVDREAPISWANVAVLCPSCEKPARVSFRFLPTGAKTRYCKRCNEVLE